MMIDMKKAYPISYDLQFFAKEGPGGEKTEEPTSKRLEDARKKGQVAKSREITMAFDLLAFFLLLRFYVDTVGLRFENFFSYIYNEIPQAVKMVDGYVPFSEIRSLVNNFLLEIMITIAPFLLVGFAVSLITNIVQVGWKVTSEPLKPNFGKLNPINGFKKIFSIQSLFELGKSLLKITLIGVVVYTYFRGSEDSIYLLYDIPLKSAIALMGNMVINLGLRVAAVYMIVAIVDLIYQRRKFHEDMKMTKQEVKDEYKNTEGNPEIKGRQRQRMREASQRRMMQELPKADVVITNPTHYAVAIQYDQDNFPAPVVIAKGSDYLAQRIKDAARENDIEIVENKPLARMLYANVEIGEMIPQELYTAVAEVLAFVYHLKGKA